MNDLFIKAYIKGTQLKDNIATKAKAEVAHLSHDQRGMELL